MQISEQHKKIGMILVGALIVVLIILGVKLISTVGNKNDVPATITVNGTGEIKATPDVSKFSATIEETAKDQSMALAASSEKVNNLITALRTIGIAEKDIKTEYTSVNPKYEYPSKNAEIMMYPPVAANPVITGYTSSHTLSVKVRNLEWVSAVQKAFTDAKVQNVSGPDLSIDDIDDLKLDAREKAIADAKKQAKILSKQLHVRLVSIVSFNENGDGAYPMYMSARADSAMMAGKAATPEASIATGEQTITSNVSITYKIR
jgi:uncharacterized protein YggE